MRELTPSTYKKDNTGYRAVSSPENEGPILLSVNSRGNLGFKRSYSGYDAGTELIGKVIHVSSITVYESYQALPSSYNYPSSTYLLALANNALPVNLYRGGGGQAWANTGAVQTDSFYVDDSDGTVYRATETSPYFEAIGKIDNSDSLNSFTTNDTKVAMNTAVGQAIKTAISGLDTSVGSLQIDVSGLQTDVSGVQTDVGNLQSATGSLQTDVGTLQTDVSALQQSIGDIDTLLTALNSGAGV